MTDNSHGVPQHGERVKFPWGNGYLDGVVVGEVAATGATGKSYVVVALVDDIASYRSERTPAIAVPSSKVLPA